jgi:hypothetical protein
MSNVKFAIRYEGPGYFTGNERSTLPVWTLELLDDKGEGTDVKYEVWAEHDQFYTPNGDESVAHPTLHEALQEALRNLLLFIGPIGSH